MKRCKVTYENDDIRLVLDVFRDSEDMMELLKSGNFEEFSMADLTIKDAMLFSISTIEEVGYEEYLIVVKYFDKNISFYVSGNVNAFNGDHAMESFRINGFDYIEDIENIQFNKNTTEDAYTFEMIE